jgi:hypothetical protein
MRKMATPGRAGIDSGVEKFRKVMAPIFEHEAFFQKMHKICHLVRRFEEVLKNNGLYKKTRRKCLNILKKFPKNCPIKAGLKANGTSGQVSFYGENVTS